MLYDVHIYATFRTKIDGIEASSAKEAASIALRETDLHNLSSRAELDYAEEVHGCLVDQQGDEDYERSTYLKWDEIPEEAVSKDSK